MITKVPFQLAGGTQPLILIPVRVNAAGPRPFILDTGAVMSLLSPEFARELGLESTRREVGHGIGGPLSVGMGGTVSVRVGEAARDSMDIAVTEVVNQIGSRVGATIWGDLGHDFLRDYSLTLDYERNELTLRSAGEVAQDVGTFQWIPLRLLSPQKPLILVDVQLNGRGPFPFIVDTGASRSVVSPAIASEVSDLEERPVFGAGGVVTGLRGRVKSLAIGPVRQADHQVVVLDALGPLNQALGSRVEGIVGFNFLSRYLVGIDYPQSRVGFAAR